MLVGIYMSEGEDGIKKEQVDNLGVQLRSSIMRFLSLLLDCLSLIRVKRLSTCWGIDKGGLGGGQGGRSLVGGCTGAAAWAKEVKKVCKVNSIALVPLRVLGGT